MLCITISSSEQDIQGGYRVGTFITILRSWEHTNDRKPAVWDVRLRGGQCSGQWGVAMASLGDSAANRLIGEVV